MRSPRSRTPLAESPGPFCGPTLSLVRDPLITVRIESPRAGRRSFRLKGFVGFVVKEMYDIGRELEWEDSSTIAKAAILLDDVYFHLYVSRDRMTL